MEEEKRKKEKRRKQKKSVSPSPCALVLACVLIQSLFLSQIKKILKKKSHTVWSHLYEISQIGKSIKTDLMVDSNYRYMGMGSNLIGLRG